MTWDARVGAIATVVATLLAIMGAVRSFRKSAQEQRDKIAKQIQDTKQSAYNDGNADARRELSARIDLLSSQLDDARRDRDLQQARADRNEESARQAWAAAARPHREEGPQ